MRYPGDLIPIIRARISSSVVQCASQTVPHDSVLQEFLEVAYHASFHTEEGRQTQFHLIYCDPILFLPESTSGFYKFNYRHFPFGENKAFTASEIVKIAPVANHKQTFICVYNFATGGGVQLKVWGLLDIGPTWSKFGTECHEAILPPEGLRVSSVSPGELTVSYRSCVLIHLQNGVIEPPRLDVFSNPGVMDFFSKPLRELQEMIHGSMPTDNLRDAYSHFGETCLKGFVSRIVKLIQEKRHGGTIIFIPESLVLDQDCLLEKFRIKYALSATYPWEYLVEFIKSTSESVGFPLLLQDRSGKLQISDAERLSWLRKERDIYFSKFVEISSFISDLSLVDGAVLLTDRLGVLGFGVEILSSESNVGAVNFFEDGRCKRKDIDAFGTRHRSAFRLCSEFGECIVFTVSQDGAAKLIKKSGDEVWYWSCSSPWDMYI